jgi:hypothetical protein
MQPPIRFPDDILITSPQINRCGCGSREMTLCPLNTDRSHLLLLSPKQQQQQRNSPRDGAPLRSPSTSSPSSRATTKMARCGGGGGLERSLSFKNWEAGGGGINGARPGTLAVLNRSQQQQQPSPRAASSAQQVVLEYFSPRLRAELDEAATRVQRVFKGHRTRRSLADCAIVVEELWWKAYDSASLSIKSIAFFDVHKQETAASRWSRAGKRIAKVGKGLSKDDKAQKLALQHWLEAVINNKHCSLAHLASFFPINSSTIKIEYIYIYIYILKNFLLLLQIDPRHRYGHNLHLYYDIWSASSSTEPFFYWYN